jgi:hypothetical protein
MPKPLTRFPVARWLAAVILCLAHLGCAPPTGASMVVDPLIQAAIRMNRDGSAEQTWTYHHGNAEPYWVVLVPVGTKASELDTIEFPDNWRAAAKDCLEDGQAAVILAEAAQSSCVHPIVVPELRDLQAVRKASGEPTVFTLHKGKGNPWVEAIE